MAERLFKLFSSTILASFCITCILHSNLGSFATTSANVAFSNWFPISIGLAGFIVEAVIVVALLLLHEGIGLTGIVNMTVGSVFIDIFNAILPYHPLMVLALPLLGVAWAWMAQAQFGESNSNLLTTALMKKTGKSISLIRGIQECSFLVIGFIGSNCVTVFTLVLSLFLEKMLGVIYKLIKFNPVDLKHQYIIKGK